MYNPELGVFMSHDPLGYIDSMNMYAYCTNNPVNYVDPWGEWAIIAKEPPAITRSKHYNRNQYNTWQPRNAAQAERSGWTKLSWFKAAYHKQGPKENRRNQKWVSPSGKCEVVYDETGTEIVTDPVNMGTYNFFPASDAENHYKYDVKPYILWGNTPDDPTKRWHRKLGTYRGELPE